MASRSQAEDKRQLRCWQAASISAGCGRSCPTPSRLLTLWYDAQHRHCVYSWPREFWIKQRPCHWIWPMIRDLKTRAAERRFATRFSINTTQALTTDRHAIRRTRSWSANKQAYTSLPAGGAGRHSPGREPRSGPQCLPAPPGPTTAEMEALPAFGLGVRAGNQEQARVRAA